MRVVVAENSELVYIGVHLDTDRSLSWEELQDIKDKYYPNLAFVEVYPQKSEIINRANERHLFCIKGQKVPHLSIIECEMDIKIYEYEEGAEK